jgi:hypothetical protein
MVGPDHLRHANIVKYGRLPRTFNPAVPHWSALRMGAAPIAVPETVDYTVGLPANLGAMLNDTLGDCAEAGWYHADQVWSVAAGKPILTASDSAVQALYETQGYVPGNPSTDRGTVLQSLLAYLVTTGAPFADGSRQKLTAFVELDPKNSADLDRATYESGLLYLGFNMPAFMQALESPGSVWDIQPGSDQSIIGGHCVISPGYEPGRRRIVTWGSADYWMTDAFWARFVDECYALVSAEFAESSGLTPLGMPIPALEAQMQALRMAA